MPAIRVSIWKERESVLVLKDSSEKRKMLYSGVLSLSQPLPGTMSSKEMTVPDESFQVRGSS